MKALSFRDTLYFFPFHKTTIIKLSLKILVSLFLIKHHGMKIYEWKEVGLHALLISALELAFNLRQSRFTPGGNFPVPFVWEDGWVTPDLDALRNRETPCLCLELNPEFSVVQPIIAKD